MALYYYNQYNVINTTTYIESAWTMNLNVSTYLYDAYLAYNFNTTTNVYSTVGNTVDSSGSVMTPAGTALYKVESDRIVRYVLASNTFISGNNYTSARSYKYNANSSVNTTYSRGNLVQSNIIAEDGTYPNDGKSDSYWYVRGVIVTPSVPSSITVPSIIKGLDTITVSWGSSSYAQGYKLEKQINGGSWVTEYSGGSLSAIFVIDIGIDTITFRVSAYNGITYSGVRTSSTITIKWFPEFKIRINGVLKTSDDGWVRVNGVLKKIDTIKVRINGVLKEV